MIKWQITNNIISKLFINDQNIIKPWGFETADSSAFFSLEKNVGYRYNILKETSASNSETNNGEIVVKMREGKWKLIHEDKIINNNTIHRKYDLKCLEDSFFMDYVTRFRFKKEFFKKALIDDKTFFHENTNIYHQYPVDEVKLFGKKNYDVVIKTIKSSVPEGMKSFMYVRDREDEWIVHSRMLPIRFDKNVIKLCNEWFKTRPIPNIFTKIVLKNKKWKNNLWYRGEFSAFRSKWLRFINPAAFPMIKHKKGTVLSWHVEFKVEYK